MSFGPNIAPFRPASTTPPQTTWAFFRWAVEGAWPGILWATFWSAAAGSLEAISATILGRVVDAANTTAPEAVFQEHFWLFALFLGFYLILRPTVFGISTSATSITLEPNLFPLILSRIHRWTIGQAVTFFDNDFAGRIAQKQMQVARATTDVVSGMVETMSFSLASVVGSVALLMAIDVRVSGLLVIWVLAYVLFIRGFLKRVRGASGARAAARAMVTGQIVDTVTNMKTVKLFANARHEDRVALDAMETFRDRAIEYGLISSWFRLVLMALAGLLPVMLVGGTVWLWTKGDATAGEIAAAGAISFRLAQMTGWVSFSLMSIFGNLGEVEDGVKTLTPPYTLADAPDAAVMPHVEGRIQMEGVSFAYGRRKGGLDEVTLTVAAGEKIGVVGASGAGKTTLVSLLLRLYDTEKGRVLIDGIDVRSVTQESLRRQIGMVTQETAMFNRTARENILYGNPDATMEQVIAAAKQAEAHEFILGLKDFQGRTGYDAFLGERGVKLSGGQRQRIALARAFLKDAPILVLDEATSALDSEVEANIQSALSKVMQGKTVLAIAHRLSTIAEMDRIVVLDEGRIVEQGSHAELLAMNGLYARYWNRQSGGFIGVDEKEAAQ
ncbi:MAG: multidrug ABC transporter ATP-binding protein [Rhodobacterales bacterium RIFCSPHIGHO2_02_FULL_62_130]|nr:MAG: multidrug ABC transporter ATP-binding protein [Rhodobacterales bacterium RIFCSPHIGHO2_02_FULL_62_130]OHC56728.1 MAG: multidrug ABC transporter ATP-binding protein [Rhodobacterales bacterium RIFCSPHIGHO2_12_FULL_62_75]HCZ00767.1 multidrug ABC transporter ATP-binding protein [Rhodobacter sp.]